MKLTDKIDNREILLPLKEKDSIITWYDLDEVLRTRYGAEVFVYPYFGDKVGYDTFEVLGYYAWFGVRMDDGHFLSYDDFDAEAVSGKIRNNWTGAYLKDNLPDAWIDGLKSLLSMDFREPGVIKNYDASGISWPPYFLLQDSDGRYCFPMKYLAPGKYRHLTFPKQNVVEINYDGPGQFRIVRSRGLPDYEEIIKNKTPQSLTTELFESYKKHKRYLEWIHK